MSHLDGRPRVSVAWSSSGLEDALITVVAMSHGELSRYDTLLRVQRREMRVREAVTLMQALGGGGRPPQVAAAPIPETAARPTRL